MVLAAIVGQEHDAAIADRDDAFAGACRREHRRLRGVAPSRAMSPRRPPRVAMTLHTSLARSRRESIVRCPSSARSLLLRLNVDISPECSLGAADAR
jgi:hypothetical protein